MYPKLPFVLNLLLVLKAAYTAPSHHGDSQIHWGPCDPSVVNDASLSCGFLDVPLDYHDLSVGDAHLALIKVNATGERRGSVFFNPGGPGASGVSEMSTLKGLLLQLTGGVYDIISWDPRGVGSLTVPGEIFCFDNLEEYTTFFNGTIELTGINETGNFTDPADVEAFLAQAPTMQRKYEELGRKCLNSPNGKYLKYIGTAAAVRDMVSIADALDGPEAPINYFGTSYGSLLGSWFVSMFPERVGRVIINGVPNPVTFATQKPSDYFAHELVSADTIYKAMLTGCALTGPASCPAASEGDGPLDIDAKFQTLLKAAHDAAKVNSSVPLTSGQIRAALANEMYAPADWARFMQEDYPQLGQIVNGEAPATSNGSLTRRWEDLRRRNPLLPTPKRAASSVNDSPSYSIYAITCGDTTDLHATGATMEEQFKGIIDTARNISHMFGATWPAPNYLCAYWPVRSVERYQGPFNKKLANKIIVASNVYDPVTPLHGPEAIASQLGEDAVLIRQNGFGHTTLATVSTCTNDILAAYMVNGTLPASNTLCEVDADFELFGGVNTEDVLAHLPSTDI